MHHRVPVMAKELRRPCDSSFTSQFTWPTSFAPDTDDTLLATCALQRQSLMSRPPPNSDTAEPPYQFGLAYLDR